MSAAVPQRTTVPWWVRDVGFAVACLVVGILLMWKLPEVRVVWWSGQDPANVLTPGAAGMLAVACLGTVLRRTVPVAGLLLVVAVLITGPFVNGVTDLATLLVFTDLLFCSILHTGQRTSRIVTVSTGVVTVLVALMVLITLGSRTAVLSLLNMLVLVAVPVLWGVEVRRHRDLADSAHLRADQAARMAELDREAALVAERSRMARDLHDIVAGQLSAIALQSEAALEHRDPELRERVLRGVREASVSALSEMRTMIGLLKETAPEDPRTAPARLDQLEPLLTSAQAWGLDVRVHDERPPEAATSAGVELAAYRIIQEGLTNVAKHAPGAGVTVLLTHADGRLVVSVANGPGRTPVPLGASGTSTGTGLAGLAERAAAVGGTVTGGPDGTGWLLAASLPLPGAAVASR